MNYFGNFGGGMIPNNQPVPRTGNWLPAEQLQQLMKDNTQFKLSVTEQDLARGQCNHYTPDGKSALIPDQDGSGGCTCSLCGTHFHSIEMDYAQVQAATQTMSDILNTIKIMYLSIDPKAAMEFFQIIPFLEKTPDLYKIACEDFKKYEGVCNFTPTMGLNAVNVFNTIMGGYNPAMGYANPMMPQQQPMGGYANNMAPQQPMGGYANNMAPQQPMNQAAMNPMYSQQPMGGYANNMMPQQQTMGGYAPQQQGYSFSPTGAAAPQQLVNTNMPVQGQAPQTPATSSANASEVVKVEPTFKK